MNREQIQKTYADLLGRQRPVSVRHPPMPRLSRAAQFAPFAALTGHSDAVSETARLTQTRPELDEGVIPVQILVDGSFAALQKGGGSGRALPEPFDQGLQMAGLSQKGGEDHKKTGPQGKKKEQGGDGISALHSSAS